MNKQAFLAELRKGLSGLPQSEIEEWLSFYSEMIDDRTEEGLSEQDAVRQIGNMDEIIAQILADAPPAKPAKERAAPKKGLRAWEIVLLVLGSPVWLSLGIALFAVILSLYISLWAAIISLWAVWVSVAGCGLGGIAAGIGFAFGGHELTGIAVTGAGFICAGLSIFLFYSCKAAAKGSLILTKKLAIWIKNSFGKREEV